MDAFTEAELDQIIAFYQTDIGRKVLTKMPELMTKGMLLGQQRVQDHRSELEAMIQSRMQELQRRGRTPQ